MTAAEKLPSIEDLHDAIDKLVQPQRQKVYRDDTRRIEWHTIPSVWQQLETSVMWAGSNSGGGAFGSRPTISTSAVAIIMEAAQAAAETAVAVTGKNRGNVPANLRAIAANLISAGEEGQLTWWVEAVRRWTHEARCALGLVPQHPKWARDTSCPDCGAKNATAQQDGEEVRTPALAITWTEPPDREQYHADNEWHVRAIECRACSQVWWRGPDLDHLVDQMLKNNTTRETMTNIPDVGQ